MNTINGHLNWNMNLVNDKLNWRLNINIKGNRKEYHKQYYLINKGKIKHHIKQYRKSDTGKLVYAKSRYKRNFGFSIVYIIPLSIWKYLDIDKTDFHHLNNMLVSSIPHNIHKANLGDNHRVLISNWYQSIGIDINSLLEDNRGK